MVFNYKKAMVTGSAGFIGSHIVEELLKKNIKVVSIDNYSSGKEENLTNFRGNPNFEENKCDITDYKKLRDYFDGVDIVFHNAASKKNICLRDPRSDLDVNAKGTLNVLELAGAFGVKKVIHASTGSVYGEAIYYPQDENHPLKPTSYYGVSKLAAEKYADVLARLNNIDVTVLRYFHVYGPRQDSSELGGVVSIFARRALKDEPLIIYGDGTQQRSFTYIKDLVEINMLVATSENTKWQIYNCASGIRVTILQLAETIKKMLGKKDLKIIYKDWVLGDIKIFIVDNSKLCSLGYEFKTDFKTGLKETIDWLQNSLRENK